MSDSDVSIISSQSSYSGESYTNWEIWYRGEIKVLKALLKIEKSWVKDKDKEIARLAKDKDKEIAWIVKDKEKEIDWLDKVYDK